MENTIIRIKEITIQDFKNVNYGNISFDNLKKDYKASILGLYGQNGSGKTALIDVVALLKLLLCGQQIPLKYADYINVDKNYSTIKYLINVDNYNEHIHYDVTYEFKIKKQLVQSNQNFENHNNIKEEYQAIIFDEILCCSYTDDKEKNILKPVIDTSKDSLYAFEPKNKFESLIGKENDKINDVKVFKKYTSINSRSFIFSQELLNVIRNNPQAETKYKFLLESLVYYGNIGLFVFNTTNTGLLSLNALPLAFRINENKMGAIGNIMIKLDGPTSIPMHTLNVVRKVIGNMNIVLQQIVPGLTIDVKEIGTDVLPNNELVSKIYLVSKKNNKEIPLKYESEGIKKIISILQLLIVIYNNSTITVAIDELDSGVFEYLLGEIIKIISENGKGQLIFTSHNLRPLETLDKGFIAFTTTNQNNRYIRLTNVKTNNNLRDFYFRDIILGEQNENVYEKTNNFEIALAFKEAGEYIGS